MTLGPGVAVACHGLVQKALPAHLMKPLREMISAWQSLTVSPLRLSESPFTQRFPAGASTASVKGRRAAAARAALRVEADTASAPQTHRALPSGARPASCPGHRREVRPLPPGLDLAPSGGRGGRAAPRTDLSPG